MWTCGDIFKTLYFLLRDAPLQFWICGALQVTVDFLILLQVFIYRGNTDPQRVRPHRVDWVVIVWTHEDEVKDQKSEKTEHCNGNVENNLEVTEDDKSESKVNGEAVCNDTAGINEISSISNSQSDVNSLSSKERALNSSADNYNDSLASDCPSESGVCANVDNVCVVSAEVHNENELTYNGGIDSSNTDYSSNDESSTIVYNVHIDEKCEDFCLNCRHRIVSNKNSYKRQKKRNVDTLVHRHTLWRILIAY